MRARRHNLFHKSFAFLADMMTTTATKMTSNLLSKLRSSIKAHNLIISELGSLELYYL